MQTRLARSWTALRYGPNSQRALDNAARAIVEHERLLAEIDAMARRIDAALPADGTQNDVQDDSQNGQSSQQVA